MIDGWYLRIPQQGLDEKKYVCHINPTVIFLDVDYHFQFFAEYINISYYTIYNTTIVLTHITSH